MSGLLKIILGLMAPIYNRIIYLIAYGPWGNFVHRILIFGFRKLYKIEDEPNTSHKKLGQFFLRSRDIFISSSVLVSPTECTRMEKPTKINLNSSVAVKSIDYNWREFFEFQDSWASSTFWNLYLAPNDYHWVHSPCEAPYWEICRVPGKTYPVNALGRLLIPHLYLENERLSFRTQHLQLGWVYVLCVGAMGVSRILTSYGQFPARKWSKIDQSIKKSAALAAFQLGSSVLLIVEKPPQSPLVLSSPFLKVGEALV